MALITAARRFFARIVRISGEAGASLVEYTLLVALIAAVAIGAVSFLGTQAKDTLDCAGKAIAQQDECTADPAPAP